MAVRVERSGQQSLEMRHLGRILTQSVLVGAVVGAAVVATFFAFESTFHFLVERIAGYDPPRPSGEHPLPIVGRVSHGPVLALIVAFPALGGLAAGLIAHRFAPEAFGGGADAAIAAFHLARGSIRRRIAVVKVVVSTLTLGTGGSGGREGPSLFIGAALGSLIARLMRLSVRERRILLVAGAAAGMSAMFRTPLGAALLAVEVLYRDDFESDALVPAVIASVTAFSIFVSAFPSAGPLFARADRYPFVPVHLPLYAVLAVVICVAALAFLAALRAVHRALERAKIPRWLRPAVGGLALGLLVALWLGALAPAVGLGRRPVGLLGTGYGAAELAIVGRGAFGSDWGAVRLLVMFAAFKLVATAFTVGSDGSAGDFGPSLVIGGLVGGAFGRVAHILVDSAVDPGSFALVGMGVFYGALAHTPLSSLVMVCEMAGNYDLLVPLMLAEGVAYVLLRRTRLYPSQAISRFDSPAHESEMVVDVLRSVRVADALPADRAFASFSVRTSAGEIARTAMAARKQRAFPVVADDGRLVGLIAAENLRVLLREHLLERVAIAADLAEEPTSVRDSDDLHVALERMLEHGLQAIPVVRDDGTIRAMLDEADLTRAYHDGVSPTRTEHESDVGPLPRAKPPG